jgi:L-threonylcarbamoyladenylate synthase
MVIKGTDIDRFRALNLAVNTINEGGIVAYPTETFYGLGVRFDIEKSLKRLYDIKQRPHEKAMPLVIGSPALLPFVSAPVNTTAISLMDRFWPGPLTLILHAKEGLSDFITAGTHKVAVRIPGDSFALELAKLINLPITATSANPSGRSPAQDAETVVRYFGEEIDLVIDCGPAPGGLPSTIVDVTGDYIEIMREGVIRKESLSPAG